MIIRYEETKGIFKDFDTKDIIDISRKGKEIFIHYSGSVGGDVVDFKTEEQAKKMEKAMLRKTCICGAILLTGKCQGAS